MIDITGADPIGDERVERGENRWQQGDLVLWKTFEGWRGGEVGLPAMGSLVQVIDWRQLDWYWVAAVRLRRNLPRQD